MTDLSCIINFGYHLTATQKDFFGINVIDYSSYEIYLHSSPQQSVSLIKKTKLPKKTFPTCYNTIVLALLPLDTPDSLSLVNM